MRWTTSQKFAVLFLMAASVMLLLSWNQTWDVPVITILRAMMIGGFYFWFELLKEKKSALPTEPESTLAA
jgi:hypothetical protein